MSTPRKTTRKASTFRFLNADLPIEERIDDLIARMNIDEKCRQLLHQAPAIPRLKVPAYNWWNEALHGVGRNGRATVFPQAIAMAATFDDKLVRKVADAIADEARAKHHEAARKGQHQQYQGLTFWSPNINIFRDPRWGRGQETWGEDPVLTAEMGAAFVKGLQGTDKRYLKTAACAKHYAVHSGPESLRHEFDARPTPKDLWETYLPAFERLVREGVESVMGAYNRTNGEPCCASRFLMEDILRGRWKFKGHYLSDCWALRDFHEYHKITKTPEQSAALALQTGCDLNCGCIYEHLRAAWEQGLVSEEDIDRSLRRLMRTRFRLGMFDPPERVPYAQTPMEVVDCDEHRRLALQSAERGIVLLKNANNTLPLNDISSMLLVGPTAANTEVLLGNYFGLNPRLVSIQEGIINSLPEGVRIDYRRGCLTMQHSPNRRTWAGFEAANNDVTVLCVGLTPNMEGEEGDAIASELGDRQDIKLPENQIRFVKKICSAARKKGKKTVLVVTGGSAIDITELHELADAVLFAWYPGEEGGTAVANILFGKTNPSGHLPVTFPKSIDDLPPFEDYSMQGRTYRYMEAAPLYPFGFGLSYNRTSFSRLKLSKKKLREGEKLSVEVRVSNKDKRAGEEVVQVYLSHQEAPFRVPQSQLVAFKRIKLKSGGSKDVRLQLPAEAFTLVNDDGERVYVPGKVQVTVANSAPVERSQVLGASKPVAQTITLI